jgi:NAD(P)H-hydrate repair Nnr-like enzyme with NAD(P)H-hydrate dehydratase domain
MILDTIDQPVIEELEPIGGTGDTITGIAAALAASGMPVPDACAAACRANRMAGMLARPTPATQIYEIIEKIPWALARVLEKNRSQYEICDGVKSDVG